MGCQAWLPNGLAIVSVEIGQALAAAQLSQNGSKPLLGSLRLPFPLALLAFDSQKRDQKPRRFWLSIKHLSCSFRELQPGQPFAPSLISYATKVP
jgi:hypothetical protein